MSGTKTRPTDLKETDGTTLDTIIDSDELLPHGLVRLPTGPIAVTQLFCPNGHNLVDGSRSARFNRFPGITLMVEGRCQRGTVTLSPIHGDETRFGAADFEPGEVTRVTCPRCGVEFPPIQPCGCTEGADLVGLYLDEALTEGNQVAFCTAWGCLRSRIMDRYQVISRFE